MSRSARLGAVLVSAVMALAMAGCGSDDSGTGSGSDSSVVKKDSSGTSTVDITFKGDTVTPSGAKVEVKAGDPLKLHITADKAGEIHVHSSPEQHIEYERRHHGQDPHHRPARRHRRRVALARQAHPPAHGALSAPGRGPRGRAP